MYVKSHLTSAWSFFRTACCVSEASVLKLMVRMTGPCVSDVLVVMIAFIPGWMVWRTGCHSYYVIMIQYCIWCLSVLSEATLMLSEIVDKAP